jgi:hypothetical protein
VDETTPPGPTGCEGIVGKQSPPTVDESINGAEQPEKVFEDNGKFVSNGNPGYGNGVVGGYAIAGEDESTGPLYISGLKGVLPVEPMIRCAPEPPT